MIIYILGKFPHYSQTFVTDEVKGFSEKRETEVFSLLPADPTGIIRSSPRFPVHFKIFTGYLIKILSRSVNYTELAGYAYALKWAFAAASRIPSGAVLRIHLPKYSGLAALVISKIKKIPYVPVFHSYDLFGHNPFLLEICRNAEYVETISEYNRQRIKSITGIDAVVLRCGVDTGRIRFTSEKKRYGVFAGRLHRTKGLDRLVRIFAGSGIEIKVVGGGDVRAYRKIMKRGNIKAEFTGPLPHDEVIKIIQDAAFLILPSRISRNGDRDGIPVVLMEAMAAGTPVVTTAVSGIPELVKNGRTGYIFERDEEARQICLRLIEEYPSGTAETARAFVEEHYNITKNIEEKYRILNEIIIRDRLTD